MEEKIAFLESVSGFGLSVGPLVGGALFELGGWNLPFIFNIISSLIIIPVMIKQFPSSFNKNRKENIIQVYTDSCYDNGNEKQNTNNTKINASSEESSVELTSKIYW